MFCAELKHLAHRFFVAETDDVVEGAAGFGAKGYGVRIEEVQVSNVL